MVKHNNQIPNVHCKKKWHDSTRGPLKVKLALNQAQKKKSRRMKRAAKAAAIAPRPLQRLRPVVRSQTQRYSAKTRLGRGFTLAEIKAAGLTAAYARTVGIAVDHRRTNRSVEGMDANVARLTEYTSKLIVFPKKRGVIKSGDSSKEETAAATQFAGDILPIAKASTGIVMEEVTEEMKANVAYTMMRLARQETKVEGYRIAVEARKKKD
uniref:60S ribosomal protein L13 n=1 Tax=Chaetoceros debilis TaxID=122233 RepID=A0A7S3PYZ7_9STRA|mmetsp:Transcript_4253/g.6235  ORF Transcript_4253/g.6235 Transcript_4253/m.6235 type:complete len:210 (-) Transcript_4253:349-978(-)|eukprot:CAMPEP_0197736362 /NCGR_PEP_ID=MMETSP1435-20131217/1648_1 /TAXON_ID=426625 /ORGANISM="Chaetoceros brevis, Strain CCMP164" /LENGTH=209 /DNA_ID=CAMNT_0043324475 /DNA_START=28 /DNA_END=657 /DNA_ORIENTATION=-